MLSPMALKVQSALASMIPNNIEKCQHLRVTQAAMTQNLKAYKQLYTAMRYPKAWWEPHFRKCTEMGAAHPCITDCRVR